MDLSKKRCIACEGWMKPMPNFLIKKYLKKVKRWKIKKGKLYKEFRFKNFKEALKFVNKVGDLAEKHKHHPKIIIDYNIVLVSSTTHEERGLTSKDFELAEDIDKILS